eukprot:2600215-Amphidinium_carterae.1
MTPNNSCDHPKNTITGHRGVPGESERDFVVYCKWALRSVLRHWLSQTKAWREPNTSWNNKKRVAQHEIILHRSNRAV